MMLVSAYNIVIEKALKMAVACFCVPRGSSSCFCLSEGSPKLVTVLDPHSFQTALFALGHRICVFSCPC